MQPVNISGSGAYSSAILTIYILVSLETSLMLYILIDRKQVHPCKNLS